MKPSRTGQTKPTATAGETRPGPLGRPVARVLAGTLILAALAWGAVELWGESQDDAADVAAPAPTISEPAAPPAPTASENSPGNTAPTDRDPTPQSGSGGDSEVNTPTGTQTPPPAQ